jgi:hypothetical protein
MPETVPGFWLPNEKKSPGATFKNSAKSSAAMAGGVSVLFEAPAARSSAGKNSSYECWIIGQPLGQIEAATMLSGLRS